MAQQVNFFWFGDDEAEFFGHLRRAPGLRVLPTTSRVEVFDALTELPGADQPGWFHLWLWHSAHCAPPITRWIPQKKHFTVDRFASEVIELSRSFEKDGRLVRGRLWVEMSGWRQDAPERTFRKSEVFGKWYKSIETWMRKRYTRLSSGDLIAAGAEAFCRRGGRLVGAEFSPVVAMVSHEGR